MFNLNKNSDSNSILISGGNWDVNTSGAANPLLKMVPSSSSYTGTLIFDSVKLNYTVGSADSLFDIKCVGDFDVEFAEDTELTLKGNSAANIFKPNSGMANTGENLDIHISKGVTFTFDSTVGGNNFLSDDSRANIKDNGAVWKVSQPTGRPSIWI